MNQLKACTLTVLLSTFTFAQQSRAATIAPPLSEQVKQVARGSLVPSIMLILASNSSVPLAVYPTVFNWCKPCRNTEPLSSSPGFERNSFTREIQP